MTESPQNSAGTGRVAESSAAPLADPAQQETDTSGVEIAVGLAMLIPGLLGITKLEKAYWLLALAGVFLLLTWRMKIVSDLKQASRHGAHPREAWRLRWKALGRLAVLLALCYAGFSVSIAFGGRSLVPVPGTSVVPDVTGMPEYEARKAIRGAQLLAPPPEGCIARSGASHVRSQNPEGGLYVKRGSEVKLAFSKRVTLKLSSSTLKGGKVVTVATARVTDVPNNALLCEYRNVKFFANPRGVARIKVGPNRHDGTYVATIESKPNHSSIKITAADGTSSATKMLGSIPSRSTSRSNQTTTPLGRHIATLAFTIQPGSASAGSAFGQQPEVEAEDAQGRVVSSYHGTVTLSIPGEPGQLRGCTQSLKNGRASFSGCTIATAGTYKLHAFDEALMIRGDSAEFVVAR